MKLSSEGAFSNSQKYLLVLLLVSFQLFAAYEIRKHSINNAGSEVSNQRFRLNGSIAQVDANTTIGSNRFQLTPGYWQRNTDLIFTNGFK